jgi:hypothetical protein
VTTDTMHDYEFAAPWAVSSSLAYNRTAVEWLVLNGYRGDYMANDATSQQSVARMQSLYPAILGGLDAAAAKRICFMATKVAVWKALEGDHVQISSSSLPASQQPVMDNLITALLADASADRSVLGTQRTTMTETIDDNLPGHAASLHAAGGGTGLAYYGPLQLSVTVSNYYSSGYGSLDQLFLTAEGLNSENVRFVTFGGVTTFPPATPATPLPTGQASGTTTTGQYFSAADCTVTSAGSTTTWTSPVFYMQVPEDRGPVPTSPATAADQLTIHSMTKLEDVGLVAGTPVTLVWADSSGIQDWNHVQAYMGAANDGYQTNLYTTAALPLGTTALGHLQISKKVENTTPDDGAQDYEFAVYRADSSSGPFTEQVQLTANNTFSANSVDPVRDVFSIKRGNTATIRDLPAGWYQVVEINTGIALDSVTFQVDDTLGNLSAPAATTIGSGNYLADAVELKDVVPPSDYNLNPRLVVFTNTKPKPDIRIYIQKLAFEITNDARIYDRGSAYNFRLESSIDGTNWAPVDLTGVNFGGADSRVVDASAGQFSMFTTGGCYIDPPSPRSGERYRITELDPDSDQVPSYSIMGQDGSGITNYEDTSFAQAGARLSTSGFPALTHQTYFTAFANAKTVTGKISLQKQVLRDGVPDASNSDLFPFRVTYIDNTTGSGTRQDVPLATNPAMAFPKSVSFFVDGVTPDRLTNPDANGFPTVIWLKQGETASIIGLPESTYQITEYPTGTAVGNGYSTSNRVILDATSAQMGTADGTTTPTLDLINGSQTVVFVNQRNSDTPTPTPSGVDITTPSGVDDSGTDDDDDSGTDDDGDSDTDDDNSGTDDHSSPDTSDASNPSLLFAMAMASAAGMLLLAVIYRFTVRRGSRGRGRRR